MGLKRCTYCNEEIPENMVRCPYCCSILSWGSVPSSAPSDVEAKHREEPGRQMAKEEEAGMRMTKVKVNKPARTQDIEGGKQIFRKPPAEGLQSIKRLTNGQKVFLTVVTVMFPIIGQIIGILFSIIVLAYIKEPDQQSFASALLAAGIIVFMLSCFFLMMISLTVIVLFLIKVI